MVSGTDSRVAVYRDFASIPAEARALLEQGGSGDLFLSAGWFDLLARHGTPPEMAARIYAVTGGDGRVDCVLVAAEGKPGSWVRGRTLSSLTSFYTMRFAPILRPGLADPSVSLRALARAIVAERPRWDLVDFGHLIREDPITTALFAAFRDAGMLVDRYFQFENWYQPTAGVSGEAYFKSRPSQLRNTVTRRGRKAAKEHKTEFRLYCSPAELASGIADYQTIYAKSWKEAEQFPDFIPNLLKHCAAQGTLRLGIFYVDGAPAAAQIWLVAGGSAMIYKLAYDEHYAGLSAGSILTKLMFDHVLDVDRPNEIDYGVGSDAYKRDWMSECRHLDGLVAYNRATLHGLLGAGLQWGGRLRRGRSEPGT
jgi:hypothetical protein